MINSELLEKLAAGTATAEDYRQFTAAFEALSNAGQQQVLTQYEALILQQQGGTVPATIAQKIASRIQAHEQQQQKAKVISLAKWLTGAAAAAAIAAIVWITWPLNNKAPQDQLVTNHPANDRLPATEGATLTLADGSTVLLDSLTNGNIATQGGIQVSKQGGQVIYSAPPANNDNNAPIAYNTMATPRGRQFQLVLPDGTKVWLNAASSIRYPTAFNGNERRVSITGEAYFEVAKLAGKPFKVNFSSPAAGPAEVEVLGTHFNINTYSDESASRTTLFEGSVVMRPVDTTSTMPMVGLKLTPGRQAVLHRKNDQPQLQAFDADPGSVLAWKNGRFRFQDATIQHIMRDVSRWYDVDIIYAKTIPEKRFTADLSRQTRLSDFLKVLELSGFRFTIDAKTLTVAQ
ncbi:FecR family protein [Paraflavitalea sp. CAU 1676]|uniref:FecR family protein n=1 Tax=Paraflavitalea sp. CAU 1676 TaxID=3032598 RepID=UPI0023DB7ECA|nr:FecR family protein [Paraflavitalea sp. CAU 1676]MDF2191405.1 DUF4974 domain-containing protein [Paraflavitalea sp. CAU 1676]